MTLTEIAYMCLEQIRSNKIVDDEEIDLRLIKDWIKLKRATFLKNKSNTNHRINLNNVQYQPFTIEKINTIVTPVAFPFADTTIQKYTIFKSIETIPGIVEGKLGPLILDLSNNDINKLNYKVVSFDNLRFTGNGLFNSKLVYAALRDEYIYLQQKSDDTFLSANLNCIIGAVFNNPADVTGFDADISDYPCSLDVIEYIKNAIYDTEFKVWLNSKEDELNNANDEN